MQTTNGKSFVYVATILGVFSSVFALWVGYHQFTDDLSQKRDFEARKIFLEYTHKKDSAREVSYILIMAEAIYDLTYEGDDQSSWSNTVLYIYCSNEDKITAEKDNLYWESFGEDFRAFLCRNKGCCAEIQRRTGERLLCLRI